jgi:predicted Zn-dependent protease
MRAFPQLAFFLLLVPGLPLAARAAAPPSPTREISEKISVRLGELRDLTDAKNFPAALTLTDRLLADAAADSYDTFVLSQVKAQICLAQNRDAAALPPLETSLALADAHPFLDARPKLDLVYLLAQVCAQLAAETKDAATLREHLDRAATLIRRWLVEAPSPTADAQLFAASVLYNRAQSATPADPAQFAAALTETEKGLAFAVHPSEQFYVLMLATLQQLGDLARAAELLELLVAQHPANPGYWQQLAATYLNLATAAKNERVLHREQLRALLAIERAQRQNFLNTPSDQFNLAGLCFNLGQFDRAVELLEKNLSASPLAADRRSWALLVRACEQSHQDALALVALEKAAARFPDDREFARALAQLRTLAAQSKP